MVLGGQIRGLTSSKGGNLFQHFIDGDYRFIGASESWRSKPMSLETPRFGIWAAVHGSRGALQDPDEPFDASWARNKNLVLEAEALGYDSVLIAQHTANPYDDEWDQLETWSASAALAALTSRIEIIAAIKPPLYHPVILAKMAQQIEHISAGRFAINVVNAWNRAEYDKAGIAFAEHDERYAYGREWIEIVEALLRGERVSFKAGILISRNFSCGLPTLIARGR
jgi:alkanesulfonate monooxygenase